MEHLLTVNHTEGKYFIMDNTLNDAGRPFGKIGSFYNTMRSATIAMFKMASCEYTNIYDLSENKYKELIKQ